MKKNNNSISPSEKIASLIEAARPQLFSNTQHSLELLEEAYSISINTLSTKEQMDILFMLAYSKAILGMYDKELIDLIQCKEYAQSINDENLYIRVMGNIAAIFSKLGLYNQAIFIFKDLLKNHTSDQDKKMYYKHQNNLIYNYHISFKKNRNLKLKIQEILDYCENGKNQDIDLYNMAHINMALYYKYENEFEKSLFHFWKVFEINKEDEFNVQNYELFIDIALVYGEMNQPKKEYKFLKKALRIAKKYHIEKLNKILYERLSLYYKSVEKFERALTFFEKFQTYKLKEEQENLRINKILENLKFSEQEESYKKLVSEYIEATLFNLEPIILAKDIEGSELKLPVDNIVCVKVNDDILEILLTDNQIVKLNQKFKDFTDNLISLIGKNHLFFFTNLRSELVNLYWMSRVDKLQKTIYLNVFSKEFSFKLTRNQFLVLKDFLKI